MSAQKDRRRANAAGHVAAGGSLLAAAGGANYLNDRVLERRGLDKPVKTVIQRKRLKPAHARYGAAKVGIRAAQVTGIPMLAYGAYNLVKPDERVPRISPKKDVAKPLIRAAAFQDARDEYARRIAKRQLTEDENARLVRHKKLGRDLSIAGGIMGLGALALRSPEAARVAASRSRRLARSPRVKRLIAREPQATKASNTLGIAAIGSGSIGSFNYAAQQRLEAKQVSKASDADARKYLTQGERRRTRAAATGVIGGAYAGIGGGLALTYSGIKDVRRMAALYEQRMQDRKPRKAAMWRKAVEPPPTEAKRGRGGVYDVRSKAKDAKFSARGAPGSPARLWRRANRKYALGLGLLAGTGPAAATAAVSLARRNENKIKRRKAADLASQQLAKSVFRSGRVAGLGRVRVTGYPKKDYFEVVDSRDQKRWVHRSRLIPVKDKKLRPPAKPVQQELPFEKRDDKFLRQYKDRISPKAEDGYNSLRRQRNKDRAWAATHAGLTVLNAAGLAAALKARSKPWTVVGAATTGLTGYQAGKHAKKARGYDKGPMEGIRRKARERKSQGLYGAGRGMEPVDQSSRSFGKALVPRLPRPRSLPKGLRRTPSIRRSYVSRRPTGQLVSVRGGFG